MFKRVKLSQLKLAGATVLALGLAVYAGSRDTLLRHAVAPVSDLVACPSPTHHDGDAIRCEGQRGKLMRLYAIDAPEMPGACRPGRDCTPGDPFASRDHLASLTTGHRVTYRILDHDRYGRAIVQVFADGADVSCAMVRDGYAVERYGKLRC